MRDHADYWGMAQRLIAVGLLVLALSISVTVPGNAQELDPDAGDRAAPLREGTRGAPARQPEVSQAEALAGAAPRAVVVLPAEADAYIASARPGENFGGASLFLGYHLAGEDNFGAERILIRFDVEGSIPAGVTINEAYLRLYLSFSSPATDVPMDTVLRRLAAPWDEFAVTWNTEPSWGETRAEEAVGSSAGWYEWEITELVQDWVNGVHPNHGVQIMGDELVQQRERAFNARETPTELYPQLVIDYADIVDTLPPVVSVDPLPTFVARNFVVRWSGEDQGSAGIARYDVQYRVDGGEWTDWRMDVTFTVDEFTGAEDGSVYEFRARGVDAAGNVEAFGDAEARTTADYRPPRTQVNPLPAVVSVYSFPVSWAGEDEGSGIQDYDVRYRFDGGPWVLWQEQTTETTAVFTADTDGVYEFEARAVDNIGLRESFTGQAEATTVVDVEAPFLEAHLWLPIVYGP